MAESTITGSAEKMVALANKINEVVKANFNDVEITANPGGNANTIVDFYHAEFDRRYEEYVNSPEYKKRQREAKDAQRRQNLMLEGALAVAPENMTLRDEEDWKKLIKSIAADADGYGGGIISFAERWARLMEGQIANGDTLEACAEKTSSLADNEGITGFMYGAAVSILAQVWIYGEELRHWHNLKTQIGNEGEKDGVLNPALLSIG